MNITINGVSITANKLSTETQVKDLTLDTFSFSFVSDNPLPLAPMQKVEVDNGTSVSHFVLEADSVEPFSLMVGKYRHSVSCVENIRVLTKRVLRNSVFTQPAQDRYAKTRLSAVATSETDGVYGYAVSQYGIAGGRESALTLPSREKCARAFVSIRLQVGVAETDQTSICQCHEPKSLEELNDLIPQQPQMDWAKELIVAYSLNGTNYNDTLTEDDFIGGSIPFNTEIECPYIANLFKEGATNVALYPSTYNLLLDGAMNKSVGAHIPFFSAQLVIRCETYYFSAYDILENIRNRDRKAHFTATRYPVERTALFELPTSGELYELLNNTIAPNFYFTQCTLFEAVAEVFWLFDAIFTMDGNNVLGISYFNKREGEVSPKLTGMNTALGEERYNNGLISFYQDARAKDEFPHNGYAHLRTENVGVPQDGDHCFLTPHPIHDIIHASMKVSIAVYTSLQGSAYNTLLAVNGYPLDMTDYIIEKSIWSSVLSTTDQVPTSDPTLIRQVNTVYFSQGDNKIEVAYPYKTSWGVNKYTLGNACNCAMWAMLGWINPTYSANDNSVVVPYFNNASPNWSNVLMRVAYHTSVDGRVEIEGSANKYEGEILIDQSNGAVDLGKLGLNILGLSYKLGEPTLNVSYKVTDWENRVKPGQTITYQGAVWVANSCNYVFLGNGYYQGRISFVKNYNELSLRKSILREKRMSNISASLTQKSEENIIEYCYLSSIEDEVLRLPEDTCFRADYFQEALANSFGVDTPLRSLGYCVLDNGQYIYIPTIKYGSGNMVCFEMSFADPMTAGVQTTTSETGWFDTISYYSKYITYPNEDGFLDYPSFYLVANEEPDFDEQMPIVPQPNETAFEINALEYRKNPNEILALNYSICFLTANQGEFVGSAFIERNFFVDGSRIINLYLYYGNEPYSVLDSKGKGARTPITSVALVRGDYGEIDFSHEEVSVSHWAICDSNGNILFASNSSGYSNTEKRLYFALRNSRI